MMEDYRQEYIYLHLLKKNFWLLQTFCMELVNIPL